MLKKCLPSCEKLLFRTSGLADFRLNSFFVFALDCKAYSLPSVPRESDDTLVSKQNIKLQSILLA